MSKKEEHFKAKVTLREILNIDILAVKKGGDSMAAIESLLKKSLVVVLNEGTDEDGKDIMKRYTYSSIKQSAPTENLYQAAVAISGLYTGTVFEINTVDTNLLHQ